MKTQVAIIGAGPSGLLLARLLSRAGIRSVILERQSQDHVESRIRAGVLEQGLQDLLVRAGVGERMLSEGLPHHGVAISHENQLLRIDLSDLTAGKQVMVYGQTEVTKDLYAAVLEDERVQIIFKAEQVAPTHYLIEDADSSGPRVSFEHRGLQNTIFADYIAGCDGFHGASRASVPKDRIQEFERVYPFGWLGLLSETPPVHEELIYANHEDGFALCSMRSRTRSRYYVQVDRDDVVENWSDNRFWDVLRTRLPSAISDQLVTGPAIEKSIAPLRSFVAEPLRFGALFLVGDAGHIVPPTGAKGLNLAASDIHYLSSALIAHYNHGNEELLNLYSAAALARVWSAVRFSWWFTSLTHRFGEDKLAYKLQLAELQHLGVSRHAQATFAEQYVGMPFDTRFDRYAKTA